MSRANLVNTEVIVRLSRSVTATGSDPWTLRIIDHRSGTVILHITMNNATFADMMSSRQAGRTADAELMQAPWHGKWAVRESRRVEAGGKSGEDLDDLMEETAMHLLVTDPVLSESGFEWYYAGYTDGGGGSSTRNLTFVRYTDERTRPS